VFFLTTAKLAPVDYDTSYDVYDAHVCSASAPCVSYPVSPPPCTTTDSCREAPHRQPQVFGPAGSATFSGEGNVVSPVSKKSKAKPLTRAQKLMRALRTCHKKKSRKTRIACERQAKNRYGPKRAHKADVNKRGRR
jgi:hypothetical protein